MRIRPAGLLVPVVLAMALGAAARPTRKPSEDDLERAMRALWEQHVEWTRMFIISAAAGAADKDATTTRLLQNQTDIGNAIVPYYGRAAGDKLTALLKDHILIAADLVAAAKAGNTAQVDAANAKWRANATDIATFLHGANAKYWPQATLQSLLFTHLDQTIKEATDRLHGDYAADVADYDAIEKHALVMADALSEGIIKQHPSMFAGR